LEELDNSYDEDLDSEDQDGTENGGDGQQQTPDMGGNAIAGQGDPSLGASA
jgi:hypothetical protein